MWGSLNPIAIASGDNEHFAFVLNMRSFFYRLIVEHYCTTTKCFCFQEFMINSIPDVFKQLQAAS